MPKKGHRERILEAAQSLVLSKGFPATTVDELCATAGVTKGSFYYHFDSKDALATPLVDHFYEAVEQELLEGAHLQKADPVERVDAFLSHTVQVLDNPASVFRHGCVLGSLSLDLSETHPEIRAELANRFDRLEAILAVDFKRALRANGSQPNVDAKTLARQFLAVLQGSIVLAKAHLDHSMMAEGMRCFQTSVRALLAR